MRSGKEMDPLALDPQVSVLEARWEGAGRRGARPTPVPGLPTDVFLKLSVSPDPRGPHCPP